jgi:hypothetical protein
MVINDVKPIVLKNIIFYTDYLKQLESIIITKGINESLMFIWLSLPAILMSYKTDRHLVDNKCRSIL